MKAANPAYLMSHIQAVKPLVLEVNHIVFPAPISFSMVKRFILYLVYLIIFFPLSLIRLDEHLINRFWKQCSLFKFLPNFVTYSNISFFSFHLYFPEACELCSTYTHSFQVLLVSKYECSPLSLCLGIRSVACLLFISLKPR